MINKKVVFNRSKKQHFEVKCSFSPYQEGMRKRDTRELKIKFESEIFSQEKRAEIICYPPDLEPCHAAQFTVWRKVTVGNIISLLIVSIEHYIYRQCILSIGIVD